MNVPGISNYLRPMSRRRVLVVCAIYLLVTVYFDWITGPSVSLTVFYVLPVGLLTWFMGRRSGYVLAVAASVLWFAIDLTGTYTLRSSGLYWNAAVRCGLMLVIAALVHACRQLTGEIEKLVAAKTASLQAEVAARQQAEDAMRALAARVSAAEDAERRLLAQDLHDTVGQDLTALRLTLEATIGELQGNGTGLAGLHAACAIVDRVIQQTRGLTRDLYPAMLDDFGLVSALRSHAAQFSERTGIQVSVSEADVPRSLPTPLANFMYRAVKELINNAAKHGPARQIVVHLRGREGGLRVIVDDDGRGFLPPPMVRDSRSQTGLGLAWIGERLHALGGKLLLESVPGSGARVILDVPDVATAATSGKEAQ
jgi:signal transduction histidine kinase